METAESLRQMVCKKQETVTATEGEAVKNPKTSTLLRHADTGVSVRLLEADRSFLRDLSKVQILSTDLAAPHHYGHLKGRSTRSLGRLEAAGIITSKSLYIAGEKPATVYQFANPAVARAYGGGLPVTGAKRTDFHELMTARAYFALGRPADFRVAAYMSRDEIDQCRDTRPDALYTDPTTGELVLVEADAGHYTQKQINEKMGKWSSAGLRQVWAQPARGVSANVPASADVQVLRL